MKFKTSTGSILEPTSEEICQQYLDAGYEVVTEKVNEEKPLEEPAKKAASKKKN